MISGRRNSTGRSAKAAEAVPGGVPVRSRSAVSGEAPQPLQQSTPSEDPNLNPIAELTELRLLRETAGKVTHELNNAMTVLFCRSALLAGALQGTEAGERIVSEFESVLNQAATQVRILSQACRNCDRQAAPRSNLHF